MQAIEHRTMDSIQKHYTKSTHCGYCHQKKPVEESWALPSISKLMQGKGYCNSGSLSFDEPDLPLEEYQKLIKDGWRRSGSYMYKPDMLRSCCRHYTIRTNYDMYINGGFFTKNTRKSLRKFYNHVDAPTPKQAAGADLLSLYKARDGKGSFQSVLLPNNFSMEKFELFKKYQMAVHNEPEEKVTEYSFYNFLCDDAFESKDSDYERADWAEINREWSSGVVGPHLQALRGPIHECYVIDGQFSAISVLDILPDGISAVYFIWNPELAHLGLGTISAVREIVMAQILGKSHYYLGFYIPDCHKMVYKSKFGGEIRNFGRAPDGSDPEWMDIAVANKCTSFVSGRWAVFDTNGKDVAEEEYGALVAADPSSFRVVDKACLFPRPAVVP